MTPAANEGLDRKLDICASALKEARRLALAGVFVPLCAQLLSRAADVLDEVDEALARLQTSISRDWLARKSELRGELEDIQMLIPHEHRWQQRLSRSADRPGA